MITEELVARINFLARKQKSEGLTPEEKDEQKKVRETYLAGIRKQVRNQMDGIGIKKKEGCQHHHHHNCDCGKH